MSNDASMKGSASASPSMNTMFRAPSRNAASCPWVSIAAVASRAMTLRTLPASDRAARAVPAATSSTMSCGRHGNASSIHAAPVVNGSLCAESSNAAACAVNASRTRLA